MEVREIRPDEYEETGRVTALAYREFVLPGETSWEEYLEEIADVPGRVGRSLVLVAVEDGRVLGSATLELGERIDGDDPPLAADEAHIRMLGVHPDARGRGVASAPDRRQRRTSAAGGAIEDDAPHHDAHDDRAGHVRTDGFERLEDRVFPDGFVLLSFEKAIPPG